MAWMIKYQGQTLDSDDFTIEELGEVERASGEPWSVVNPLRSVKVARAFLAVLMLRTMDKDEVPSALKALTLKKMRTAFEYRSDEEDDDASGVAQGPLESPEETTPESSAGEPARDGPHP